MACIHMYSIIMSAPKRVYSYLVFMLVLFTRYIHLNTMHCKMHQVLQLQEYDREVLVKYIL